MDPGESVETDDDAVAAAAAAVSLVRQEEATTIRPIPEESVRRIVAGQAISDLASCTKELIDNALDAGSKNINSECVMDG